MTMAKTDREWFREFEEMDTDQIRQALANGTLCHETTQAAKR